MKNKILGCTLVLLLFAHAAVLAQHKVVQGNQWSRKYALKLRESVTRYERDIKLIEKNDTDTLSINPRFYSLFTPLMLYPSALDQAFGYGMNIADSFAARTHAGRDLYPLTSFDREKQFTYEVNRLLAKTYVLKPSFVALTQKDMDSIKSVNTEALFNGQPVKNAVVESDVSLKNNLQNTTKAVLKKPTYWSTSAKFEFSFSQNYFSDNWSKGGETNQQMLTTLEFHLNYSKGKIQFENTYDAKLGFYTSTSDTCHRVRTNNDLQRIKSKIGYRAAKNVYYTFEVAAWTQSMAYYDANQTTFRSNFMAPFYANFSAGIDYKRSFKRGSFSAYIAPLSAYNYRFVRYNAPTRDENGNITKQGLGTRYYGIRQGRHHKEDFGTKITLELKDFKIMENMYLRSYMWLYTDYTRTESEWENTFSFKINKYLSSTLFFHTRFDDNVGRANYHNKYGYFQLKEYMTLGLSYSW